MGIVLLGTRIVRALCGQVWALYCTLLYCRGWAFYVHCAARFGHCALYGHCAFAGAGDCTGIVQFRNCTLYGIVLLGLGIVRALYG